MASRNGATPVTTAEAVAGGRRKGTPQERPSSRVPPSEANTVIELLSEQYPKCFAIYEARRRPLKIGIRDEITAALNGAITAAELAWALRYYTGNTGYLRSMKPGAARIDLNGEPAGIVSAGEAEHARAQLASRNRTPPPPPSSPIPRIGLSDLKAAAARRRQAGAR